MYSRLLSISLSYSGDISNLTLIQWVLDLFPQNVCLCSLSLHKKKWQGHSFNWRKFSLASSPTDLAASEYIWGQQVYSLKVKTPVSHFKVPGLVTQLWRLTPASCCCTPWEAVLIAPVLMSMTPQWDTWIGLLAPIWPNPIWCRHLKRELACDTSLIYIYIRYIRLCIYLSLCVFRITLQPTSLLSFWPSYPVVFTCLIVVASYLLYLLLFSLPWNWLSLFLLLQVLPTLPLDVCMAAVSRPLVLSLEVPTREAFADLSLPNFVFFPSISCIWRPMICLSKL